MKRRRLPKPSPKTRSDLLIAIGAVGLGVAGMLVHVAVGVAVWSVAALLAGLFLVNVEGRR